MPESPVVAESVICVAAPAVVVVAGPSVTGTVALVGEPVATESVIPADVVL